MFLVGSVFFFSFTILRRHKLNKWYDSVLDIGWKMSAQKGYFRCLGKWWNYFWKTFTNMNWLWEKKYLQKIAFFKVLGRGGLHHLTDLFHIQMSSVMHSNQRFPFFQKTNKHQLKWRFWKISKKFWIKFSGCFLVF